MKKCYVFVLLLLSIGATAQINPSDILVGGNIGFSTAKYLITEGEQKQSNFTVTPRVSVAVAHNWVLGLQFGYSHNKSSANAGTYSSSQGSFFTPGIFVKHLMPIKGDFGWFAQMDGSYGWGTQKANYNGASSQQKNYTTAATLKPGLYYKPASSVLLFLDAGGAGYVHLVSKTNLEKSSSDAFSITLFQNFVFGLDFIF